VGPAVTHFRQSILQTSRNAGSACVLARRVTAARRSGASHEGARAHGNFRGGMMKSNLVARCFVVILLVVAFVWTMNSSSAAQSGRKSQPAQSPQTVT